MHEDSRSNRGNIIIKNINKILSIFSKSKCFVAIKLFFIVRDTCKDLSSYFASHSYLLQ
jgi:hypothetical protein